MSDADRQIELAYSMLAMNGVPRQRAGSVANGIDVLTTRFRKAEQAYAQHVAQLCAILNNAVNPHSNQCVSNNVNLITACDCDYGKTLTNDEPTLHSIE